MINYNGTLITDSQKPIFTVKNRAFAYADGLFETMRATFLSSSYQIPLFDYHFARLTKGMKILGYELLESDFLYQELIKTILSISISNKTDFRIRLTIFRNEGGLYTPTETKANFVIQAEPIAPLSFSAIPKKYGFFDQIPIYPTICTPLKRTDALLYVLAGKYRQENNLDEVFLLNHLGRIAEASYSTLFMYKNKTWFTPPSSEGGIEGVMKQFLLRNQQQLGVYIEEKPISKEDIIEAEGIFTTNALQVIQFVYAADEHIKETIEQLFDNVVSSIFAN